MRIAPNSTQALDLARVLVIHGELAPRLTLQTILQAGGYSVDVAGTSSEALSKLDNNRYELVLSDSTAANRNLLAYARVKDYHPATATITSYEPALKRRPRSSPHKFSIRTEGVPHLLGRVADLIGIRASRRYRNTLKVSA